MIPPPPHPARDLLSLPGHRELLEEERVLLLLARLDPPSEVLERAFRIASSPGFRWDRVVADATRLWVHPLVAVNALSPTLAPTLPESARRAWMLAHLAARARHGAYYRRLLPIFERWQARGIETTLLKGAALTETLYPVGTRILNDIDVHVRPEHLDGAGQIVEEAGFRRYHWRGNGHPTRASTERARVYVAETSLGRTPLVIDLHGHLTDPTSPFRFQAESRARTSVRLGEGPVHCSILGREDHVIHLALQLATDAVIKLQRVADLVALVEHSAGSLAPLDWHLLEERSVDAGAEGPVSLALRWVMACGTDVPTTLVGDLESRAKGGATATAILLDARALLPRYRLRACAAPALASLYLPRGGPRRRKLLAFPGKVMERQRRAGRSRLGSLWQGLRSLPLAYAALLLFRFLRPLHEVGAHRTSEGLRSLIWARAEPPSRPSNG